MLFAFKLINRNYLLICNSVYDDRYNFTYIVHRSVTAATIALDLHCSMQKNRILNICRHSLMHARYYLPNVCHGIYWVSWHLVQLGRWKLRVKSDIPHFGICIDYFICFQKQFFMTKWKCWIKRMFFLIQMIAVYVFLSVCSPQKHQCLQLSVLHNILAIICTFSS